MGEVKPSCYKLISNGHRRHLHAGSESQYVTNRLSDPNRISNLFKRTATITPRKTGFSFVEGKTRNALLDARYLTV